VGAGGGVGVGQGGGGGGGHGGGAGRCPPPPTTATAPPGPAEATTRPPPIQAAAPSSPAEATTPGPEPGPAPPKPTTAPASPATAVTPEPPGPPETYAQASADAVPVGAPASAHTSVITPNSRTATADRLDSDPCTTQSMGRPVGIHAEDQLKYPEGGISARPGLTLPTKIPAAVEHGWCARAYLGPEAAHEPAVTPKWQADSGS
jgi:hypothetical protein